MIKKTKIFSIEVVVAALSFVLVVGMVAQKLAVPKNPATVALADDEVKQLLLLMDTDKNGKISKKEFIDFMSTETL